MSRRRVCSLVSLTALLLLSLAPVAWAGGKPEMETITFSDTFEDEELSDACGVDVTTSFTGRVKLFVFPDRPVGPQDLTTISFTFTARAGDNVAVLKDVGIDVVRVRPDGTAVLSIVGQVPFEFTGILKVDLDTGEAILEPHHVVDTTRVCHLLTK